MFSSPSSGDKLLAGDPDKDKYFDLKGGEFSSPSSGDKLLAVRSRTWLQARLGSSRLLLAEISC